MKNDKQIKIREPLPAKEANAMLDALIVALYLEVGEERAAAIVEKAKTIKPSAAK